MTQGYTSNVPISIDTGLSPTTNNLVPSQLAVKTYVDAQVGGAVASVSGTTNRISSTGGTTPVIDIDAAYVGQSSLTTLGTVTTGVWTGTDVAAADGGTGRSSHTAYAVLCGGTTTTGAQQSIASVGTSGQILTSNGAAALPTFQAAAAGGGGLVFLASATASASATLDFTTNIDATYNTYIFIYTSLLPATDLAYLYVRTSTDGGSTFDSGASDYQFLQVVGTGTTWIHGYSIAEAYIRVSYQLGSATNEGTSGNLILYNPSDTDFTRFNGHSVESNSLGWPMGGNTWGIRKSAADVDAVRFLMSTGNIASGTISMYGMTKPS